MKLIKSLATTLLALFMLASCAEKEVYLFSGHREPALDGLHFLYSYDGYHWDSLPGTWLTPEVGNKAPEYYNVLTQSMDASQDTLHHESRLPCPLFLNDQGHQ